MFFLIFTSCLSFSAGTLLQFSRLLDASIEIIIFKGIILKTWEIVHFFVSPLVKLYFAAVKKFKVFELLHN